MYLKYAELRKVSVFVQTLEGCDSYLYITTLGHLREVLLLFKRFIFFIIGHTENPQSRFKRVYPFSEHNKLRHERNVYRFSVTKISHKLLKYTRFPIMKTMHLPVQLGGHFSSVSYISAVNQPKSCRNGGSERNTVIYKRKRCGSCNIFPLRSGCATLKNFTLSSLSKSNNNGHNLQNHAIDTEI